MKSVSARLFEEAREVWDRIVQHPFVRELYTGVLPREKFLYYALQDYNYLTTMMRVFSILASKSPPSTARAALEIAHADATVEMENYARLLNSLGSSMEEAERTTPAPTNVSYMSYMVSTCSLGGPAECLAVVLPCFWSYEYIAEKSKRLLESNRDEVYVQWAKVYLSDEYRSLVRRLRKLLDRHGREADYGRLREIFLTASRFEYMFWDMAYRMEEWPV